MDLAGQGAGVGAEGDAAPISALSRRWLPLLVAPAIAPTTAPMPAPFAALEVCCSLVYGLVVEQPAIATAAANGRARSTDFFMVTLPIYTLIKGKTTIAQIIVMPPIMPDQSGVEHGQQVIEEQ